MLQFLATGMEDGVAIDVPMSSDSDVQATTITTTVKLSGRKAILEKFANNTNHRDIQRAILAKSVANRCLWTIIFIAAVSMFSFQCTMLLQRYLRYQKKIVIEM